MDAGGEGSLQGQVTECDMREPNTMDEGDELSLQCGRRAAGICTTGGECASATESAVW